MMLEGAGFEVFDLGINTDAEKFIAALEEHKPDILGMSALLTTTMPYMKVVIETLKERGIRDDYIVLVGGAPLNEEFGKAIGADAYCRDAAVGVRDREGARPPAPRRPRGLMAVTAKGRGRVLVIGCGALANEMLAVVRASGLRDIDVTCLPAKLHQRPAGIPEAARTKIRAGREQGYERIFVAYADCGTYGMLDHVLDEEGVERLPGAHCYEFYSGTAAFEAMTEQEPATFFLTDYLARNFERLVIGGLGIDRHPELLPMYFGNYKRIVYLAQSDDPVALTLARAAADRLGLEFELRRTGLAPFAAAMAGLTERPALAIIDQAGAA